MNNNQTVEVSTAFGKVRARGSDIIHVLSLVVICLTAYILWQHKQDEKENNTVVVNAIDKSASEQKAAIDGATDAQLEMNYLMTLTQEQRQKLKVEMPESLRKRTRD